MEFCKKMFIKYRELIIYGFFGILTTVVDFGTFYLFTEIVPLSESTILPNSISFVVAVLFAYLTNRTWVFQSKVKGAKGLAKEFGSFFTMRIASGVLSVAFLYLAVDVLGGNALLWKLVSTVAVVILNFIISKLFVFKSDKAVTTEKTEKDKK